MYLLSRLFFCLVFVAVNISLVSAETDIYQLAAERQRYAVEEIELLLKENPRAWDTGEDYLGDTPVGIAIENANLPALKLFVENGYDLNPPDWFDHPLRLISPYTGTDTELHMRIMEWILVQIPANPEIDYQLVDYIENNHYDGTRLLLEYGVNPNIWVRNWKSPLDICRDEAICELLKSYGAGSNVIKTIAYAVFAIGVIALLLYLVLKPKQKVFADGKAALPERNPKKGKLFIAIGAGLMLIGGLGMLMVRYGQVVGVSIQEGKIIFYVIGFLLAFIGIKFAMNGNKLCTKDGEEVIKQKDKPLFLYLRSFNLDEADAKQSITVFAGLKVPINPWESGLAYAFGKIGNMVAIGRPGEKLATTGASRVYVNDDEWQDKVLELVEKSDLVIWTYGSTEGLRWEISKLIKIVPPEKLIIAMPFWDFKKSMREKIWDDAKKMLNPIIDKPLPETVGDSLFIYFDANWNSSWSETKPPSLFTRIATLGFWMPIQRGVKSLLSVRGYIYPDITLIERAMYILLCLIAWIVISVILIMFYGLIVTW